MQVNLKKTDSKTSNSQIIADAQYEIYQWDVVTGKYQPTGGYNYLHRASGRWHLCSHRNSAAYTVNDAMRHTLYWPPSATRASSIIVKPKPSRVFWRLDGHRPPRHGRHLGKRLLHENHQRCNNNAVLWLDNADYNTDILTAEQWRHVVSTSGGVETTVTRLLPRDCTRTPPGIYSTDNSYRTVHHHPPQTA